MRQQWNVLRMMPAGRHFASVKEMRAAIAAVAAVARRMRPTGVVNYPVAAQ